MIWATENKELVGIVFYEKSEEQQRVCKSCFESQTFEVQPTTEPIWESDLRKNEGFQCNCCKKVVMKR